MAVLVAARLRRDGVYRASALGERRLRSARPARAIRVGLAYDADGRPRHDDHSVPLFWQPAMAIEDEKAAGRTTVRSRRGATKAEIRESNQDNSDRHGIFQCDQFFHHRHDRRDPWRARPQGYCDRPGCRRSAASAGRKLRVSPVHRRDGRHGPARRTGAGGVVGFRPGGRIQDSRIPQRQAGSRAVLLFADRGRDRRRRSVESSGRRSDKGALLVGGAQRHRRGPAVGVSDAAGKQRARHGEVEEFEGHQFSGPG